MKKKIIVVVFSFFCFLMNAQSILQNDVCQKVKKATFEVVVKCSSEDNLQYAENFSAEDDFCVLGYAFLMDDYQFYSASHIFSLYQESLYREYYLRDYNNNLYPISEVNKFATDRDFISFSVSGFDFKNASLLSATQDFTLNQSVFFVDSKFSVCDGILLRENIEENYQEWKYFQFSSGMKLYFEGSPLVDKDGSVLGIVIAKNGFENFHFALPFVQTKNVHSNVGVVRLPFSYSIPNIENRTAKFEYRKNLELPLSFCEIQDVLINDFNSFLVSKQNALKQEFSLFSPKNSTKISKVENKLLSKNFPFLLILENNSSDFYCPEQILSYDLGKKGNIEEGSMLGFSFFHVTKPSDMTLHDFYMNRRNVMDCILEVDEVFRNINSKKIKIISCSDSYSSEIFQDGFGRSWFIDYWKFPFADSVLITFSLPSPDGFYVVAKFSSYSTAKTFNTIDLKFMSDYIHTGYRASLLQWHEFYDALSSLKMSNPLTSLFENIDYKVIFDDISLKYLPEGFDENSTLRLGTSICKASKLKTAVCYIDVFNNKNLSFGFQKVFKTSSGKNNSEWNNFLNAKSPYDANPYNYDSYTFYDEVLFLENLSDKEKKLLKTLYLLKVECKGNDKNAEINSFANSLKKLF